MLAGEHIVRKEMGYTNKEFMRLLPKAVGQTDLQIHDNEIHVHEGDGLLRIQIGDESERRLGNFRLPLLPVSLIFTGFSEPQIESALDRFWRAYQKGGG